MDMVELTMKGPQGMKLFCGELQKIQYEKIIIFLVLTYCTYFIPVWSLEIFMYLENPQILLAFIIFKTNIDSQSLKQ